MSEWGLSISRYSPVSAAHSIPFGVRNKCVACSDALAPHMKYSICIVRTGALWLMLICVSVDVLSRESRVMMIEDGGCLWCGVVDGTQSIERVWMDHRRVWKCMSWGL